MKINDIGNTPISIIQQYKKQDASKESDNALAYQGDGTPEEKISLSQQSKDKALMQSILGNIPEIREEKVQELKSRIENGQYRISAEDIARKMLTESVIDIFA